MTATLPHAEDFLSRKTDFPSLQRTDNDLPLAYLDGPAGTQVPQAVIDAVSRYYTTSNANTHGFFVTTRETDEIIHETRLALADFLGADGPQTISFGANMTSLAFALSHAFARVFQHGDEVLVTQLDHEANRGPWLGLRRHGVVVREVRLKPDGTLDYDDFAGKITDKTRLVAMGYAANAIGTVNDVPLVRRLTHQAGA
ncbi:MAG: aminotransferase class V-fold PLP-dependent enzyme, partial [Acidobacteria bacterium]|nr:aminotransferase class V-fold PLP-dependent enzyme [Acidobacteriota bacterium]